MSRTPAKRKSESRSSSSVAKSARIDKCSAASRKSTTKLSLHIKDLFDSYVNKSIGMIDPEGIEALCKDLKVDHTDARILMLAWKLKAEKQGYFTESEWQQGLAALKVDNITKLRKALPGLETEVSKPENFDDFYRFAFNYCLTEDKQKNVDVDSACVLLDLVLKSKYPSQVKHMKLYLQNQRDYKVINKDQWINILRFCQEISFPDLANYDSAQAWPLILDNFVDWMKETQS
ncbi:OLC1v1035684C1 [Oldenlandia corymbosa var. corymbosa]|uniref:Defective in cullin neddylation protein n=1 Tax=Oldenlandia corymbosa var. corymbosa TaxID=529605 RepID=A0AAV1CU87_OLDCO|nr:OLC1v1035684C1 [Oldenlandia corymbosa var. corymbosa]